MKLNLLPKTVSAAGRNRVFVVLAVLIALIGIAAALLLSIYSVQAAQEAVAEAEALEDDAALALATAQLAEEVIQQGTQFNTNLALSEAMNAHNFKYTDLYRDVLAYTPSFFRVINISATPGAAPDAGAGGGGGGFGQGGPAGPAAGPAGPGGLGGPAMMGGPGTVGGPTPGGAGAAAEEEAEATVDQLHPVNINITGVVETYEEYANVMLAYMRMPGEPVVNRSGYTLLEPLVPALTETDQSGEAIAPGETPLPDEFPARLESLIARAAADPQGFQNQAGFGTDVNGRGAMPGWSIINLTITVMVDESLLPPNPAATLSPGGGGGGAGGGPGGGFGGMSGPGGPGGFAGGGPGVPVGGPPIGR
jgi:hypothetical protein